MNCGLVKNLHANRSVSVKQECRGRLYDLIFSSVSIFVFSLIFSYSANVLAAESPLTQRYSVNTPGDIDLIGNAIVTCDTSLAGCVTAMNDGQPSNTWTMFHIDVDSDGSTFNSSSADLSLPAGATVLFAGLYWIGTYAGATIAPPDNAARTNVKFSTPSSGGYLDIAGTELGFTTTNDDSYGVFADVTSLVQAGGSGTYTTANIQVTTGDGNTGPWGGWSLAIAYQDPAITTCRNLTVFDGYENFFFTTESVTVSGFKAPSVGPVTATLGFFMGDGDIQNSIPNDATDTLLFEGTVLSDALNPTDNFFNNTVTEFGANALSARLAETLSYPNLL